MQKTSKEVAYNNWSHFPEPRNFFWRLFYSSQNVDFAIAKSSDCAKVSVALGVPKAHIEATSSELEAYTNPLATTNTRKQERGLPSVTFLRKFLILANVICLFETVYADTLRPTYLTDVALQDMEIHHETFGGQQSIDIEHVDTENVLAYWSVPSDSAGGPLEVVGISVPEVVVGDGDCFLTVNGPMDSDLGVNVCMFGGAQELKAYFTEKNFRFRVGGPMVNVRGNTDSGDGVIINGLTSEY